MGLFRFLKALFQAAQGAEEKSDHYLSMSSEELQRLSEEELLCAVLARIESKVDSFADVKTGMAGLSEKERIVYAVNCLEAEVNNGGLCQFLVNSSRVAAPIVSACMEAIGAEEHKKLYDGFIEKNKIDVNNLSSFDIRTAKDFQKQAERYPFDDYDDAFYRLQPLSAYLTTFIKRNISCFSA